jgi:hypothetical protein
MYITAPFCVLNLWQPDSPHCKINQYIFSNKLKADLEIRDENIHDSANTPRLGSSLIVENFFNLFLLARNKIWLNNSWHIISYCKVCV